MSTSFKKSFTIMDNGNVKSFRIELQGFKIRLLKALGGIKTLSNCLKTVIEISWKTFRYTEVCI